MQIEEQIRHYVRENLLFGDARVQYDDNTSFLENGFVDSMGIMELVAFVQSEFGFEVDPMEILPEHFDSVNGLAGYIRRKQNNVCSSPTA
jgi:acyl carrier protein